jgi:hypothetical protein
LLDLLFIAWVTIVLTLHVGYGFAKWHDIVYWYGFQQSLNRGEVTHLSNSLGESIAAAFDYQPVTRLDSAVPSSSGPGLDRFEAIPDGIKVATIDLAKYERMGFHMGDYSNKVLS